MVFSSTDDWGTLRSSLNFVCALQHGSQYRGSFRGLQVFLLHCNKNFTSDLCAPWRFAHASFYL
ncbi:hypothetical protein VITFI_CDS2427 [Vitreoscilla filiformis]|uniref:Uncharacterized protein n=1 Tax=Vitreoscilla filiformis TaxID=63 RepID=A0A221KGW9_VITFI|nr:hypothetical protein VITFI_CDS2427 [Vitreoscilla filiformis]